MKKLYQKPDAEYIKFISAEAITDVFDGEYGSGEIPDDWE